jgi:phage terminase large subunit-like protein
MHGPPRYGKSIIVGQRLIPWLLMHNPAWRCPLMTYNIDHSTEFGEVIRDIMRSDYYRSVAPEGAWLEREDCSAKAFKTVARAATLDGDYSFRALGFQTGFTGKGADCLVGDDPYANPEDAKSEAVNGRTIRTYQNQIKLRVGADSPLIFMYHRYHEQDLGGVLLEEGGWDNLRFPCLADSRDNADGSDPTGRKDGELLSPLWPEEHILDIKATDPYTFASMYQGRPKPPEGAFFKSEDFRIASCPPLDLLVRYWDLATSTKQTGDWTAGALGGVAPNQNFHLKDVTRFKLEWPDACQLIAEITEKEAWECAQKGVRYVVGVDARLSQQGFFQQLMRQRIFNPDGEGMTVPLWPDKTPIDKKQSASGLAADARFGRLFLQLGPWNQIFINEALAFTGEDIDIDDQIDAASGCHRLVWALKGGIAHDRPSNQPGTNAAFDRLLARRRNPSNGRGIFRTS